LQQQERGDERGWRKKTPLQNMVKNGNKPICARHRALNKHMGKVIMFIPTGDIYIRRGVIFEGI